MQCAPTALVCSTQLLAAELKLLIQRHNFAAGIEPGAHLHIFIKHILYTVNNFLYANAIF